MTASVPAAAAVTIAGGGSPRGLTGDQAALAHVRAVTAQYRDVTAALADGFVPTEECAESPMGGMGIHYVHPQRLMEPVDPDRPQILLYSQDGAHLTLLGAEWLVPDADQDLSTDNDRPSLFGHDFDGPMPGHDAQMPIHYDLHVWAWRYNPAGNFTPWNPTVRCR